MKQFFSFIVVSAISLTIGAQPTLQVEQHPTPPAIVAPAAVQAPVVQQVVQQEQQYSTFNAVQLANADIIALEALHDPSLDTTQIRYLSLHNFPEAERAARKANVDFVLNSLNPHYRRIVRTASLPVNAASPVVLRVNLYDYGITPVAWDQLADNGSGATPIPDPYFHTRITPTSLNVVTVPSNWSPAFVVTNAATAAGTSEIVIACPTGNYTVSFDGKAAEADTIRTRRFTMNIQNGRTNNYAINVSGTYSGIPFNVSKTLTAASGQAYTLTIAAPTATTGTIVASAPWLALEENPGERGSTIANLTRVTNTRNPILRADWFCTYGTIAPAYYQLIGLELKNNPDPVAAVKTPKVFLQADFDRLVNVDVRSAGRDVVAAITDTRIVTLHNRILLRYPTVTGVTGGYYWQSKDTDRGIDDQDYLNNIHTFYDPNFVATEIIASGRNGLNFYFVADNKGIGLDLAAAAVAQHSDAMPTRLQDKQVWSARNCMICHGGGMITIQDRVRNIAQNRIALLINGRGDSDTARRVDEAFSPPLPPIVDHDNATFLASCRAASGLDGPTIARSQEILITNYFDRMVTLERMAWDAGVSPAKLRAALEEGVNLDYTIVAVLQNPEEPAAVLAWERQGFAALMQYLISYQPRRR